MNDDGVPIERDDSEERFLRSVLGPQLVARLYGLLRTARIYDPSNQAIRGVLLAAR